MVKGQLGLEHIWALTMNKTMDAWEPLAKGVYRLRQHRDQEFIRWCHDNPNKFVWNACEPDKHKLDTVPGILHSALPKGKLCQTFRNQYKRSRYRPHLSTTYRKVVSKNLDDLKTWAKDTPRTRICTFCRPSLLQAALKAAAKLIEKGF
jgi:hypothetical protein